MESKAYFQLEKDDADLLCCIIIKLCVTYSYVPSCNLPWPFVCEIIWLVCESSVLTLPVYSPQTCYATHFCAFI